MWMSMHMCVSMWKPEVAVGHQLQLLFHLIYRGKISQLNAELTDMACLVSLLLEYSFGLLKQELQSRLP